MSGNGGRWLCAAAMAIAAALTPATGARAESTPTPSAPEGKALVVLGDSYSANAWASQDGGCVHGSSSWPVQLSGLMGLAGSDQVADQSCTGASLDTGESYTLAIEARDADKAGAFGPKTKLVTIQFGPNDTWGGSSQNLWNASQQCLFDLADGCGTDAVAAGRMPDPQQVTGAQYAARIQKVVTYIRYYAPNAHIVLVGYPELFPAEQDSVCMDFFGVVPFTQPRGRTVVEYFNRIDQAQREAAAQLKLDYLDSRTLTAGHGACTAQPWINGVYDPTTKIDGLPFHPAPAGDAVVAKALYERYTR